jgi:sulfatase modifying factor 1
LKFLDAYTAHYTLEAGGADPCQRDVRIPRRVVEGGSFLCAPAYFRRYRPAPRRAEMVGSGMSHIGFAVCRETND